MFEIARSRAGDGRYFAAMAIALVALFLLAVLSPATIDSRPNYLFAEDGPVETLSGLGYVVCALLILLRGGVAFAWKKAFGIVIVLGFLALREFDFHTRFTTMGVMKLNFYLSGDVPLIEKLLAIFVLGLAVWAVVSIIVSYGRPFLAGLWRLEPVCIAAALSAAMAVLSKTIDGMDRKLADFGISLGQEGTLEFLKFEETLELGVPLFAIIAVMAYFGLHSNGEPT